MNREHTGKRIEVCLHPYPAQFDLEGRQGYHSNNRILNEGKQMQIINQPYIIFSFIYFICCKFSTIMLIW